ncbi:hypothetical protein PM10SUCC1_25000 [Propionigenium maris DSM 9537]|uniref:Uncharacterized protein n=1 Tax=Propionigenium maris DSM 9537 TaxID=1123000 RepID=A0A9W6LN58_9FUSO|nr:hypothetical protein PM10SUCC1_25000 [Propionigenium maris DSM 9537]
MILEGEGHMFKWKRRQLERNVLLNKLSQLTIKNKRTRILTNKKRL